jgi:hypothetical protein
MLRITALILLALAFARPFFTWKVSPPLAGSQTRSLVILLDNSFSMRFGNRFERAKDQALQVVRGLSSGDSVQLVAFSDTADVLNSAQRDHPAIQTLIRGLQPSYRSTNYAQALKLADQLLASAPNEVREIHWISDFQNTGWSDAKQDFRMDQRISVKSYDVAGADFGNAWISQVEVNPIRGQDNALLTVRARVSTAGMRASVPTALKLEINGKLLQEKRLTLEADSSQEVEFEPFSQPPGVAKGQVEFTHSDSLMPDNVFHFVSAPHKTQKLLLLGETRGHNNLYLSKALAGSADSPFTVDLQEMENRTPFELGKYAAVVINNVRSVPSQWVSPLLDFLNNGGGIIYVAGERTNPTSLGGAIEKILPAHVTGIYKAGVGKKDMAIGEIQKLHPIFDVFEPIHYSYFLSTPFSAFLQCIPHETSHVLARLEDGSPLLVEATAGNGRSLLFTSSLDMEWNDLPLKSVFLPLCQQLAKYVVHFEETPKAFLVGEVVPLGQLNPLLGRLLNQIPGRTESFSQSWKVEKPSGEKVELNDKDLLKSPSFVLEEPGFYQTTVRNFRNWIAVNVDSHESDLRKIEPQKILSAIPRDVSHSQAQPLNHSEHIGADQRLALEARQRLGWLLTLLALAILLVESLLANRYYNNMFET